MKIFHQLFLSLCLAAAVFTSTAAAEDEKPLYVFFSKKYGDHLYTTDKTEVAEADGWVAQGEAAIVDAKPSAGLVPLYRSFHIENLDHFYGTAKPEAKNGVRDEGIQCYVRKDAGDGLVALRRFYNEAMADHMLSTNSANEIVVDGQKWTFQAIEGYVKAANAATGSSSAASVSVTPTASTTTPTPTNVTHPHDANLVPMFRYWNPRLRDHYYTLNFDVLGNGKHGWRSQGIQAYIHKTQSNGTVPLYKYWNIRLGDHFYTTKWSELGNGKAGYQYKGVLGYVAADAAPGAVPLYRYFNAKIGDHFFTDNFSHLGTGKNGWKYEGIAAYVWPDPKGADGSQPAQTGGKIDQMPLLVPLYRYWNVHFRDHFYTTLWKEVEVGTHGWQFQGVQGLVYATQAEGTTPLYRYWNIQTLDHFYTTNKNVLGDGGKNGWVYEGVQCYVSAYRKPDMVPLYRYFSARISDHFYSTKWLGKNPNGWKFEGIQAYVFPRPTGKDGQSSSDASAGQGEFAAGASAAAGSKLVPLYRYWNQEIKDHFYTTNFETLKNGVRGWTYDGIQAYVHNKQAQGTVPFYRYWNARTGDHFYTTDNSKLAGSSEWKAQGVTAYVFTSADGNNAVPLFRYYNAKTGDHFYTTNFKELERGANGFEYQGIACYVAANSQRTPVRPHGSKSTPVPLYRYYNAGEQDTMLTTTAIKAVNGWTYLGIQAFVSPTADNGLVPLYSYYNAKAHDHYLSVQWTGRRSDEWSYSGIVGYVPSQKTDGSVPLYRYFSEKTHDHLYSTSWSELGNGKGGYVYQGIAAYVYPPLKAVDTTAATGAVAASSGKNVGPLYRFYDEANTDHYYSTSQSVSASMKAEGNVGFVFLRPSAGAVPLYRYRNTKVSDTFLTTNWASLGNAGSNGWVFQGVQAYIYKEKKAGTQPLYRYYSATNKDHMYTSTYLGREKDSYKLQGITGYVMTNSGSSGLTGTDASATTVSLFRYYNKATRDHLYTTRKEILGGGKGGWSYQGVSGRCLKTATSDTVPLYAYFNTRSNDHFNTIDFTKLGKGGKYGWQYQGVECYVSKTARTGWSPAYTYYSSEVKDHFFTTKFSVLGSGNDAWTYQGVGFYVLPPTESS